MTKRAMHLVQILLPTVDGEGKAIKRQRFDALLKELTERFGGATSFKQSPGQGLWDSGKEIERDTIVLIEIMADELDTNFWSGLKSRLEAELSQEQIMIRALPAAQF